MISSLKFLGRQITRRRPICVRTLSSNATYYDSQSGMHVPIHNEQEIQVYYNARNDDAIPDSLKDLKRYPTVVHGMLLPRKDDNLDIKTLLENSPDAFQVFSFSTGNSENISLVVDYDPNNPEENKSILESSVQKGWKTTIVLNNDCFQGSQEPIMVANDVAALIDATKAGNYLWISNDSGNDDSDGVVELCEELQYLDIPGPTVKSRLVVDVMDDDVVNETMMQGINKFVVTEKDQVKAVQTVAEEQGKSLILMK